ncbi:MAG: DUF362 domain-containing protein [Candidatus Obscuribacterales bacterium]|nr:DUF362 domain-containing protein [Candidatus Obscuribacterales bacterium]
MTEEEEEEEIGQPTDTINGSNDVVDPERRQFLKAAAGAVLAPPLLSACAAPDPMHMPRHISEEQRRWRRKAPSPVAIVKCASYADLPAIDLEAVTSKLQIPDVKGKKILLKINMVDFRSDRPLTTDKAVVEAAVKLMAQLGAAEIIVGDASALNRDTDYLLEATGIGQCCSKLGVPFVDLNIDDIDKVENAAGLTKEKFFAMPRTVTQCDLLISMPKLKTHRLALVTASLKNLFGAIPGRAYGWPKNFLHVNGIAPSVIDLAIAAKPGFAIMDAIVAMEGHGPLDGTPVNTGYLILGPDLAAVDAVGCRTMKIAPENVAYMRIAEEMIGNTRPEKITLTAESIEAVAREFKLPASFKREQGNKIEVEFDEKSSASSVT